MSGWWKTVLIVDEFRPPHPHTVPYAKTNRPLPLRRCYALPRNLRSLRGPARPATARRVLYGDVFLTPESVEI